MSFTKTKPTVVSLFAGCGGSSLGYKWAGYDELLAVDFDDHAEESFRANFPDIPFWNRDVRDLKGEDILGECRIVRGDLDVLDGSPPCQGFSTMSGGGASYRKRGSRNRNAGDPRNSLVLEYVRLVGEVNPKVFLMENVPGMVGGRMRGTIKEFLQKTEALGYRAKGKILTASDYGVPQKRKRVIVIGVRNDLGRDPSFPTPFDKTPVTVREALEGIKNEEWELDEASKIQGSPNFENYRKMRRGENMTKYSDGVIWQSLRRLRWNRPSWTITKGASDLFHPEEDRKLTISEIKRLCSFPDDFKLEGTFRERWARIGNSVMPLFMKVIARHIREKALA